MLEKSLRVDSPPPPPPPEVEIGLNDEYKKGQSLAESYSSLREQSYTCFCLKDIKMTFGREQVLVLMPFPYM